ncbi:hypothetical protein C8Q74DRAFT_1363558 [Fomes fomentarius]|nr:hypothetical protein C8Q74DRAFT_1363558 [Fomes fomentarius]
MQLDIFALVVAIATCMSSATAAYTPRMPLPMRLAASARAANAEADPYALPWAIAGRSRASVFSPAQTR